LTILNDFIQTQNINNLILNSLRLLCLISSVLYFFWFDPKPVYFVCIYIHFIYYISFHAQLFLSDEWMQHTHTLVCLVLPKNGEKKQTKRRSLKCYFCHMVSSSVSQFVMTLITNLLKATQQKTSRSDDK
jgi:hypothetical protein